MATPTLSSGARLLAAPGDQHRELLTPEALALLAALHAAVTGRHAELLAEPAGTATAATATTADGPARRASQRDPAWLVAPAPPGTERRTVEVVASPADPAASARALSSGADVWVADLDDATPDDWASLLAGQRALREAARLVRSTPRPEPATGTGTPGGPTAAHRTTRWRGARSAAGPAGTARPHRLPPQPNPAGAPRIVLRPRGWQAVERAVLLDGRPPAAPVVDVGLFLFHHLAARRTVAAPPPGLVLPRVGHRGEALRWHRLLLAAERLLGLEPGTVTVTVPIERVRAATEAEEILFVLRSRPAALAAAHHAYLADLVETVSAERPGTVLPERDRLPVTAPFLRACTDLLVQVGHRRGAHVIGSGTTATADAAAVGAARLVLEREAEDGFDGTRVADPALVPTARAAFAPVLRGRSHQLDRQRPEVAVTAAELLAVRRTAAPPGPEGVRAARQLVAGYTAARSEGRATVVIEGAVHDAASVALAVAQLRQWSRHGPAGARGDRQPAAGVGAPPAVPGVSPSAPPEGPAAGACGPPAGAGRRAPG
ncbi:malate synthase A [Streptomyces lonarensis]|uniref:malate synthase n=2 Tax=Streptomyces lonarensis TaxID=700599 RepID=A0A7X6CXC2_9ACTN|nr:malate synthase A [Streptomyces lonarensis]NJQ04133.1 malate synthase A [Streptomyces lonarensis]